MIEFREKEVFGWSGKDGVHMIEEKDIDQRCLYALLTCLSSKSQRPQFLRRCFIADLFDDCESLKVYSYETIQLHLKFCHERGYFSENSEINNDTIFIGDISLKGYDFLNIYDLALLTISNPTVTLP